MKGKIATASLIRAVLDKDAGLRTNRQLSQVVVFQVPGFDRLMLLTDAAINIAPTLAQKAELCRNAIEVARAIGIEKPNIAALCALELVNPEMPATIDAAASLRYESPRPDSGLLHRRPDRAGRSRSAGSRRNVRTSQARSSKLRISSWRRISRPPISCIVRSCISLKQNRGELFWAHAYPWCCFRARKLRKQRCARSPSGFCVPPWLVVSGWWLVVLPAPSLAAPAGPAATTAPALPQGTRLVHCQGAALEFLAIARLDGPLRFRIRKLDKTESAGFARIPVTHHCNGFRGNACLAKPAL